VEACRVDEECGLAFAPEIVQGENNAVGSWLESAAYANILGLASNAMAPGVFDGKITVVQHLLSPGATSLSCC